MLFIKKVSLPLVLLISTLLISACQNIPPVTSGIGAKELSLSQSYEQHLQIDNQKLAKRVHISDIKSRKQNDLLQVNLSLTSTYEKSLQLQYQFVWFDQSDFIIEAGKSSWQPIELHGMQTKTITSLAPTPLVTKFRLYVREVPEKFFKYK